MGFGSGAIVATVVSLEVETLSIKAWLLQRVWAFLVEGCTIPIG